MEALGINPVAIVAYIVNFALLAFLLNMFLYKPVKGMLADRQQKIAEGLDAASRAQDEANKQRAQFEAELRQAKESSLAEAKKVAEATEKMRQEILEDAKKQAADIVARAKKDAEEEKKAVMGDLQRYAADLALNMTRKVVDGAVDEKAQRKILDQFIAGL